MGKSDAEFSCGRGGIKNVFNVVAHHDWENTKRYGGTEHNGHYILFR